MIENTYPMIKNRPLLHRQAEKAADDFGVFWKDLIMELRTKQRVANWTREKGNFGEDFDALYLGGNYIRCVLPSAKFFQSNVPRGDFEMIYDQWADYASGRINKYFLFKNSFSRYIISILHQYGKNEASIHIA